MAGLGKKTFVAGEVLAASDVNGYLMDQSVMRFSSSAVRASELPTPSQGMMSYLDDTNSVEVYSGAVWESVSEPPVAFALATASATWDVGGSLVSIIDGTAVGLLTVTFPAGRFTVPPVVTATTLDNGTSLSAYARWAVFTNAASAVSLYVIGGQPGSATVGSGPITKATVAVHAIQMTSGVAFG
jgi:hypothetical protein